jgi:hypothetical protein
MNCWQWFARSHSGTAHADAIEAHSWAAFPAVPIRAAVKVIDRIWVYNAPRRFPAKRDGDRTRIELDMDEPAGPRMMKTTCWRYTSPSGGSTHKVELVLLYTSAGLSPTRAAGVLIRDVAAPVARRLFELN